MSGSKLMRAKKMGLMNVKSQGKKKMADLVNMIMAGEKEKKRVSKSSCKIHDSVVDKEYSMNDQWIGKGVSLQCGTLGVFQGVIDAVHLEEQTITIKNVIHNGLPSKMSSVTIEARDIKNIEFVEALANSATSRKAATSTITVQKKKTTRPVAENLAKNSSSNANSGTLGRSGKSPAAAAGGQDHHRTSPRKNLEDQYYGGGGQQRGFQAYNRSDRQTPKQKYHQAKNDDCFDVDLENIVYGKDFDFERNLALFDKQRLFEEIQSNQPDVVRLVDHNLRGSGNSKSGKSSSAAKQAADDDNTIKKASSKSTSYAAAAASNSHHQASSAHNHNHHHQQHHPSASNQQQHNTSSSKHHHHHQQQQLQHSCGGGGGRGDSAHEPKYRNDENVLPSEPAHFRIITTEETPIGEYMTESGLIVPAISYGLRERVMAAAEARGISKERLTELVARSATEVSVQLLGGARRLNPSNLHQLPLCVVLCGPGRTGAFGLAIARHLSAQGVKTFAYLPDLPLYPPHMQSELALYKLCCKGGSSKWSNQLKDLPVGGSVDLVVMALDDHEIWEQEQGQGWHKGAVRWCHEIKAPVLGIDPLASPHSPPVTFKASLLPGLPLWHEGSAAGKVYMVNLAIPNKVYKDVGISYQSPFGAKTFVALDRV